MPPTGALQPLWTLLQPRPADFSATASCLFPYHRLAPGPQRDLSLVQAKPDCKQLASTRPGLAVLGQVPTQIQPAVARRTRVSIPDTVSTRVLLRRTHRACICGHTNILQQVQNLQSGQAGWGLREHLPSESKGCQNSFLLGHPCLFFSRPSADWKRPTHPGRVICFTEELLT